jgi:hypothetical protein
MIPPWSSALTYVWKDPVYFRVNRVNPPPHGLHVAGGGQLHDWASASDDASKVKTAIILREKDSVLAIDNIKSARKKFLVMALGYNICRVSCSSKVRNHRCKELNKLDTFSSRHSASFDKKHESGFPSIS